MRYFLLPAMLFAGAFSLAAQGAEGSILPRPEVAYEKLKTFLGLSDPQVQGLIEVRQRQSDAENAIYTQISERERTLYSLLESGSTDAARIGQLMIEIRQLQKQLPLNGAPYRNDALAVLTADQKTRLPNLVAALQLQDAGWQAVWLNLIDNPNGDVHILPAGRLETTAASRNAALPAGLFHTNTSIHTRSAGK